MVDTVWGTTPLSATVAGYKSGVDLQQYKPQAEAETSLLSGKAEIQKSQIAAQKQDMASTMAARAALSAATLANTETDINTYQGNIQVYSKAIEANKNNPEVVEKLNKQKYETLHSLAQASVDQNSIKEEQKAQDYAAINQATLTEDGHKDLVDYAKKTNNRTLAGIASIIAPGSTIPVPTFGKPFSQFNEADKLNWEKEIRQAYAPNKQQETVRQTAQDIIDAAKLEEKRKKDVEDAAAKLRDDATKREKIASEERRAKAKAEAEVKKAQVKAEADKKKAETKAADHTKELAKLESDYHNRIAAKQKEERQYLDKLGVASIEDQTSASLFGMLKATDKLLPAEKEAFMKIAKEKATITEGYKAAKAILEKTKDLSIGTIKDGYKYKGGDPAEIANWEKV